MPGREVLLFRATEEPRSDEHRRTRKESSWRFRGPVTLPSQGRVHRSPEPPRALLSQATYKILTSHKLQQIGGRASLLSVAICEIKFYKYLDPSSLQVARKEVLLFRATESLDLMNIVERERRLLEVQGTGDPTLPGVGCRSLGLPELLLLRLSIKF